MPNVVKLGGGSAKFEGTATASQVLNGATFYSNDKEIKTGTMANNGAVSQALNCGGSYTIPKGYHDGSGKVTANSLASQTDGTATASQILASATAYVDGVKVTGTMTNRGAVSQALAINGTYTIPAGYHNGSGKVTQSITTLGATTYTPKTTNQTIASGKYLSGTQTIKGDSNLVASNIKSGTSIFGVSGSYIGTNPIKSRLIFEVYKPTTKSFDKTIDLNKSIVLVRNTEGHFCCGKATDTIVGASSSVTYKCTSTSITTTGTKGVIIEIIEFMYDFKSVQTINGNCNTGVGVTVDGTYIGQELVYTIQSVDVNKTIIIGGSGISVGHGAPILKDSTSVVATLRTDSSVAIIRCIIIEFA